MNPKQSESPQEKARRLGVPVIPPREKQPTPDSNPVVSVCGECGVEMRRIMHIACGRERCPYRKS